MGLRASTTATGPCLRAAGYWLADLLDVCIGLVSPSDGSGLHSCILGALPVALEFRFRDLEHWLVVWGYRFGCQAAMNRTLMAYPCATLVNVLRAIRQHGAPLRVYVNEPRQ